jgi:hypothetical protein
MKKETNGIRETSLLLPEIISAAITIKFNLTLEPGCHQKHAGTNFARPVAALGKGTHTFISALITRWTI